ncbi:uncharacterized protein LOC143064005 [Mytilus galloprovincialis]|uniref:uncharacterized protein n=1 Tax=Mytilus edulis TaxID=6550 RepID=UPI0039EF5A5B
MVHIQLCVFFLIVGLSSTVDGYCFAQPPTDCVYKEQIIKDGTRYKSFEECVNCDCRKGSLSCCFIGGYISSHSDDCKVVADGPCSQKAVLISDESQPCPQVSGVGR